MTTGSRETFRVLGTAVNALTEVEAVQEVVERVRTNQPSYVVFCTVSTVLSARSDPRVRQALSDASLVTPDGMPLVWLGRRAQERPITRVYGPDFMAALFDADESGLRHYFYGGGPGVGEELVRRLRRRWPDLVIVGAHTPGALTGTELDKADVDRINQASPDIVWVGLGHPKQELWMHTYRQALAAPVLAGVGAAFDFHSGVKKEAPNWMKRTGLQWLHRLIKEPRRLAKRYLLGNALFVVLLIRERAAHLLSRQNKSAGP